MGLANTGWDEVRAEHDSVNDATERIAKEAVSIAVANGREEFARKAGIFAYWLGGAKHAAVPTYRAALAVVVRDLLSESAFETAYRPFSNQLPAHFLDTTLDSMNLMMFEDYGQYQPQLFAFIQKLSVFGGRDWKKISDFWESPRRNPVVEAEVGLIELTRSLHRILPVHVAEDAVHQCTIFAAIQLAPDQSRLDETIAALMSTAAAEIAAGALVMREHIGEKRFHTLYSPFAQIIPLR